MKVLYVTPSGADQSSNAVYTKGLRENGIEVAEQVLELNKHGVFGIARFLREAAKNADFVIVGYDAPKLVIILKLLTNSKVVYNALCSVYERLIVSRALAPKFSLKAFYYWFLDFLACHLADLVMLESERQIKFFKRIFKVSSKKLFRAWTGVDEDKFFYNPAVRKFETFTVIFRGRLLPEAGAEYVVAAAKKVEHKGVKVVMQAFGQELPKIKALIEKIAPRNLELVTDFLPIEDLRRLLQQCHLSLGQLSDHERLERTIPHKAYESLALKLPYLTARNSGILELLRENETCLACNPADPDDLAEKILWAKAHPQELARIAAEGRRLYLAELTSKQLSSKLLQIVRQWKK